MDDPARTLTDMGWNQLYQRCKPLVWLIKYQYLEDGRAEPTHLFGTGFTSNGFLITAAHTLPPLKHCEISARPLDICQFSSYTANLVYSKWDIALFQIEKIDEEADPPQFGDFPQDCSLSKGQSLMHICGSSAGFWRFLDVNYGIGSFSVGNVQFECVNSMVLPKDNRTCEIYLPHFVDVEPRHRIMGHVCSRSTLTRSLVYVEEDEDDIVNDDDDVRNDDGANVRNDVDADPTTDLRILHQRRLLKHDQVYINEIAAKFHPEIPLVQIFGLNYDIRTAGSPVFDGKGNIVGMMLFGRCAGDAFAVHSSILKKVVKEGKRKEGERQQSSPGKVKERKKPSKKKEKVRDILQADLEKHEDEG